jgi:hypothetical protein
MKSKILNMYYFFHWDAHLLPWHHLHFWLNSCIPLPYSIILPPTLSCRWQSRHASMER